MSETTSQATGFPIEVEGLSRTFGTKQALDDVTLKVPRGCVFGLLGESGAGKTTLMRHLLGLMKPERGTVRVIGRDRKSTRLNSSHVVISYAVFCLKKKKHTSELKPPETVIMIDAA